VELSIDSNPARKTEHQKNTYLPKWNDTFTVLVTPTSILQFRVYDHSSFRKDSLIGEQTIHLIQILQHYNGRCEHLELAMDLLYDSKSEGRQLKNGELVAVFNGLKIDMASVPNSQSDENYNPQSLENFFPIGAPFRSSILNGGIRSRMRLRSSNGGPSTSAVQNGSVQNGGANGAVVQVQSPSTGAVRRSGTQWDAPPPGGIILPSGSIQPPPLQPPAAVPKPRQQLPQQQQQAFSMNGSQVSPQQQQPTPPPPASQIGQPMPPQGTPPNGAEALPEDDDEELPNGWERRIDPYGRRYYVDHNTRSTLVNYYL
jgi:NEDD4-like E3 ubiquitin-protein ligase WWP1